MLRLVPSRFCHGLHYPRVEFSLGCALDEIVIVLLLGSILPTLRSAHCRMKHSMASRSLIEIAAHIFSLGATAS